MPSNQEPFRRLQRQPDAYRAHQALLGIAPNAVLVGGAVRDLLLNRNIHDLDYVLEDGALVAARRLGDALNGAYYPLDQERGVGRVVWQTISGTRLVIDIASLRGLNLEEDLQCRDFTINAIAMMADGSIYDPMHGIDDMDASRLSTCTSSSLQRDPVRVLRAIRFLNQFELQPVENLATLVDSAIQELDLVSPERQRDELLKIIALPSPQEALGILRSWNLEARYFPELVHLCPIEPSWPHVYGAYQHSFVTLYWMARIDELYRLTSIPAEGVESAILQVLAPYHDPIQAYLNHQIVPGRARWLWLRFAALAHDWGKAITYSKDEDGHVRFLRHEIVSAELAGGWLERYHCAKNETKFVQQVCKGHMRPITLSQGERTPSRRSIYRFYHNLEDAAPAVILLHVADYLATYGPTIDLNVFRRHMEFVSRMLGPMTSAEELDLNPPSLLNGNELIKVFGLQPGPHIGDLLAGLREAQAVGEISSREQAVEWVQEQLL